MEFAYLTDSEGQWSRIKNFARRNPLVGLDENDHLQIEPGNNAFVFGGDAIDFGAQSLKILHELCRLKLEDPKRTFLILGNRDINKMRFTDELLPLPAHSRAESLKNILQKTMGAPLAFELRREELEGASDAEVVDSFIEDISPRGPLTKFLQLGEIGKILEGTLIVHGAITAENYGRIPDRKERIENPFIWIEELNQWAKTEIENWIHQKGSRGHGLIDYQKPFPGTRMNQESVVYGRFSLGAENPELPPQEIMEKLIHYGIHRIIVGHTPSGAVPTIMRWPHKFEIIIGDTSARKDGENGSILVSRNEVKIQTVDLEGNSFEIRLDHSKSCIGLKTNKSYLIKALNSTQDRAFLYRVEEGFRVDERWETLETLQPHTFEAPFHSSDLKN